MKFRFHIGLLGFLILHSCCGIPPRIWLAMDCYNAEYTGLDTLIRIDGYYEQMKIFNNQGGYKYVNGKQIALGIDTSYRTMRFFNDGYFRIGFYKQDTTFKYVPDIQIQRPGPIRNGGEGLYKIEGDTIKIKYITILPANVFGSFEQWFLIKDDATLKCIFWSEIGQEIFGSNKNTMPRARAANLGQEAHFIPLVPQIAPSEASYLKTKKRFHCDESSKK